jgi:hypothetical protein
MPKRILFFSCEPGGAEVLIPAIRLLEDVPGIDVTTTGYGYALERFSKKHVSYAEIAPINLQDPYLFNFFAPDMIITSAASLPGFDMSEKHLWIQAKRRGIPTMAMLDQWQNYTERFSGEGADERLAYMPDWINCLNETGRTAMLNEGFEARRLVMMGHPYLSSLKSDLATLDVTSLRISQRIEASEQVALFVSEPIREHYGLKRGYDQYQVLDYFLTSLAGVHFRQKIIIKLHPKDNRTSFVSISNKFPSLRVQFIYDEISPLECLAISDYIFGMSSLMLVEAYVLGKRVASLQPGLLACDPMVLSRCQLIPSITNFDQKDLLKLEFRAGTPFEVEFRSKKFIEFILRGMSSPHSIEQAK